MRERSLPTYPFDAVLLIAFGGPRKSDEVRPFVEQVVSGRGVPCERVEEVIGRYDLFGGVSPITEITLGQADGLQSRLKGLGPDLPVYVGMRNWHPFIKDTLVRMGAAGVRRTLGFIAAGHQSYASCGEYKRSVALARQEMAREGLPDIEIVYVDRWYDHELFISAWVEHIQRALGGLDADVRDEARIIFSAHSIPVKMAEGCRYCDQLMISGLLIAERLGRDDWELVYQSRSGRPEEPWLGPEVCEYLRSEHARGLKAAVIVPLGFVGDHAELLYDLDHRAAGVAKELGLPMVRADSLNDDPAFLDMMADVVQKTCERYRNSLPLPII